MRYLDFLGLGTTHQDAGALNLLSGDVKQILHLQLIVNIILDSRTCSYQMGGPALGAQIA
jgi:hypothetical protein